MWIRSQNKRILTKVNEVIVTFVDENKCFISGFWDKGSDTLGVYSTREKALKVLDEIQTSIMTEHHYHTGDESWSRGSVVVNENKKKRK